MRFAGNRIFLALASVVIAVNAGGAADVARFRGGRSQYLLY